MNLISLTTRFLMIPLFAMLVYGSLMLDKLAGLIGTPLTVGLFIASIYGSLVGFFHSAKLGFTFAGAIAIGWIIFWNLNF